MNSLWNRTAAVLAFIIGAMAIFAGGQVLLGNMPDYYVIAWLPVYNFALGLASSFFTAIVLWKNGKLALAAALTTLGLHVLVMLILLGGYREVVASDSIRAMTIRISAWAIITGLIILPSLTGKQKSS